MVPCCSSGWYRSRVSTPPPSALLGYAALRLWDKWRVQSTVHNVGPACCTANIDQRSFRIKNFSIFHKLLYLNYHFSPSISFYLSFFSLSYVRTSCVWWRTARQCWRRGYSCSSSPPSSGLLHGAQLVLPIAKNWPDIWLGWISVLYDNKLDIKLRVQPLWILMKKMQVNLIFFFDIIFYIIFPLISVIY